MQRSRWRCSSVAPAEPSPANASDDAFWEAFDWLRLPNYVQRFAAGAGIDALTQVRFCALCERVAFAIDDYEREQLDAAQFTVNGICADCLPGGVER
ncbi:MAG: hypothetical protein ACYDHH_02415 [Solirubrobacteraceae bacterium]